MLLLIDYREKAFIEILEKYVNIVNEELCNVNVHDIMINFKVTNMQVGDFAIQGYDQIHLVIERKSINDLSASIKDGRFRQQKTRLQECVNNNVVYIIEGNKQGKRNLPKKTLDSAIQNLIFKHNFKVLATDDIQDTFDNVVLLYNKLRNNDFAEACTIVPPTKLMSKGDHVSKNVFALQLNVISGVSYLVALEIAKQYPCMLDLLESYKLQPETTRATMLAPVQINEKRKVGNALSKKIIDALCNNSKLIL